jgi:hypothetical protein
MESKAATRGTSVVPKFTKLTSMLEATTVCSSDSAPFV